jgi:5-methylthioadenosine/S-adenosylhomocysteine deaminase
MPQPIIDPRAGARYALAGKVVTMNAAADVLDHGVVYIVGNRIAAVQPASAPRPDGFGGCPLLNVGGTIFPGLIELHNHLSYNVLSLWHVPQPFETRDQWRSHPDRRRLISGPLELLTNQPGYSEAIVRYVECKCLLGGTTTSQGITLSSDAGLPSLYRGEVRNVERTGDPALPSASTRIADVESAEDFAGRLAQNKRIFLHLSEGVGTRARAHFLALQQASGAWAISKNLVGIHAVGLEPADFAIVAANGGAVIWSPLSNLLLYRDTLKIGAAKASGVPIGLGSDWSPTGSKNLLGELKVAHLVSEHQGGVFSPRELAAMATIEAARILGWDASLGSIEVGKRADLLILHRSQGDPYRRLLRSDERDVKLVVIDGVPRYGTTALMNRFGPGTESFTLAGGTRRLNLSDPEATVVVGGITLTAARERLRAGLAGLPDTIPVVAPPPIGATDIQPPIWKIVLEEDEQFGAPLRPLAPISAASVVDLLIADSVPLTDLVTPVALDELTVAEAPDTFLARIDQQTNLDQEIKDGLRELYGG